MILVTGGSGLLGSYLLLSLLKQGNKVRALATQQKSIHKTLQIFKLFQAEHLFEQIEWHYGNITDTEFIFDLLDGVDFVYHCAAVVSFSPTQVEQMNMVNAVGTETLVNGCLERSVKKLCHVSSVAALGSNGTDEVNEETYFLYHPNNTAYGISKYNAEREVWRAVAEGLEVVIVNPSIILGCGDWNEGSSAMFKTAYKGLKYYSNGITGFVDVRDVAEIMIQLMNSSIKNERFIVCAENLPYRQVFDMMHDCFGQPHSSINASRTLASIIWRLEKLRSMISGKLPMITRESVNAAFRQVYYANNKLIKALNYKFIPIEQSIKTHCSLFIKSRSGEV